MKKLLLCGVALGAVAIANSASAADMPLKAPPLPWCGWAGFYAGVNVGYSWASDPATLTDTTTITSATSRDATAPVPTFAANPTTTATAAGTGNIDPKGCWAAFRAATTGNPAHLFTVLKATFKSAASEGLSPSATRRVVQPAREWAPRVSRCPGSERCAPDSVSLRRGAGWSTARPPGVRREQGQLTEGPVGGGAGGLTASANTTRPALRSGAASRPRSQTAGASSSSISTWASARSASLGLALPLRRPHSTALALKRSQPRRRPAH